MFRLAQVFKGGGNLEMNVTNCQLGLDEGIPTHCRREPEYALGHSDRELDRLTLQAKLFEPFTRQLYEEAGLGPGMRVLDVGCGSGDVAFLAADLVGSGGSVVGVDRAQAAVTRANARAQSSRLANVRFLTGDPTSLEPDASFDAIVGRLVLMYQPDPADALRRLVKHARPGGLIIFQEFDMTACKSVPASPTFERCVAWINQAFQRSGARTQLGLALYGLFLAAGLPAPTLRLDAALATGPNHPAYEVVAEVIRSLLPTMEKLEIATPEEVEIETLAQRLGKEVAAHRGVMVAPSLIGSWARKPDDEGLFVE